MCNNMLNVSMQLKKKFYTSMVVYSDKALLYNGTILRESYTSIKLFYGNGYV